MTHDDLAVLLSNDSETVMLDFLAEHRVIASSQQCCNCGAANEKMIQQIH